MYAAPVTYPSPRVMSVPTTTLAAPTYSTMMPQQGVMTVPYIEYVNPDYAGPEEWIHAGEDDFSKPLQKRGPVIAARIYSKSEVRKTILLCLGTLVMFNLLFIPTWNCVGLLRDPVLMYMIGSATATWFLLCCILLLLICYVTLQSFLNGTKKEQRTEQSLIMISCIFLSTLGVMLILFGGPLQKDALIASREFVYNCKLGHRTSELFIAQEKLQSLRAVPSCAKLASVTECEHFDTFSQMPEAQVLNAMESQYQCAGICQGVNAKDEQVYPPTLFSLADNKVSCDYMAARRLRNFDAEVSWQTVTQGIGLLVAAIFISFAQLIGFCAGGGKSELEKRGPDYGSVPEYYSQPVVYGSVPGYYSQPVVL